MGIDRASKIAAYLGLTLEPEGLLVKVKLSKPKISKQTVVVMIEKPKRQRSTAQQKRRQEATTRTLHRNVRPFDFKQPACAIAQSIIFPLLNRSPSTPRCAQRNRVILNVC
jgi:hypothetical protein